MLWINIYHSLSTSNHKILDFTLFDGINEKLQIFWYIRHELNNEQNNSFLSVLCDDENVKQMVIFDVFDGVKYELRTSNNSSHFLLTYAICDIFGSKQSDIFFSKNIMHCFKYFHLFPLTKELMTDYIINQAQNCDVYNCQNFAISMILFDSCCPNLFLQTEDVKIFANGQLCMLKMIGINALYFGHNMQRYVEWIK